MVRNIFGCEQYAVNEMHKVHSFNKFSKFVLRTYSVPESIKSNLALTALTHFTVKMDMYKSVSMFCRNVVKMDQLWDVSASLRKEYLPNSH